MNDSISLVSARRDDESIRKSISEAMNLINFNPSNEVKSIVIKPNMCYYWTTSTGETTDPRVVGGLIDVLRDQFGEKTEIVIAEADGTAMRTKHAFPMLGYRRLAKKKNVELSNLSEDEVVEKELVVNNKPLHVTVPESLLTADLFINVPKVKVMTTENVYITCAMKNLFGCIASRRKIVYHKQLNEAIVGMTKILHPHLTIVDGIIALGQFPFKLGLIMAGYNPFSIDWVVSQIMGYNPSKLEFLKIARKEGLGDPKDIVTYGEDLQHFKQLFPKKSMRLSKLSVTLRLEILKLYTKLAGDVPHPVIDGL
jgi:uncharacterized protein (DUF362 family)